MLSFPLLPTQFRRYGKLLCNIKCTDVGKYQIDRRDLLTFTV
jgi:hypothetical protein